MSTLNLPQARIPMGWAMIKGERVAVMVDQEWVRYFTTLTDRAGGVTAPNNLYTTINQLPQSAVVLESAEEGEPGPMGPPGMAGPMGAAGMSIRGMDGDDGEAPLMFPPGISDFPGNISAPKFTSFSASASANTGVATTIYTMANQASAMYLISAGTLGDAANYAGFAVIAADGATSRQAVTANAPLLTITLSGLNIQVTQSSGGTQTVNMTITRIG